MTLEDAHSHRIPKTVDVENPEALGEFIQQMVRRHHWHHTRAVVDIPREKAVINRLTLPPTPAHEVAAAVRFQAMKELPFPLEGAAIDYVVRARDDRGLTTEVLLAAVPREALEAVQATCTAAGLTAARVGLRPYSSLVSVNHLAGLADQRVLFVNVGPTTAEIDIMISGQLVFARSANVTVPMAAEASTEDSRLTSLADVTDLEGADDAVEAAVRELTVEITRTLQAYRANEPEAVIDRIVVAGGTGVEAALLEAADRRFGVRGMLFDPTEALGAPVEDSVKLRSFAAPLGLAWGLGRDGSLAIDFLNPKKPVPPRAVLKRRLRMGAMAAGVVLVAAAVTDASLYMRRSAELRTIRSESSKIRKELESYVKIENMVESVEDWQVDAVWPEHLRQLAEAAVEPGKDMLVQQMSLDARQAKMTLKKVLATEWEVPGQFVAALNALEVDGVRPYLAKQGSLRTVTSRDGDFRKAVDVEVQLRTLQKHLEEREAREKARKQKLKKL
jgi:type IV pilus assembly protein PilM